MPDPSIFRCDLSVRQRLALSLPFADVFADNEASNFAPRISKTVGLALFLHEWEPL